MARDFSKVSLNLWSSQKFEAIRDSDALRLLYLYILTSPHSNSAGCYNLKYGYGSSDLHWDVEAYRKAIDSLCDTGLIDFDKDDQTVLIANWVAFNEPTNAKHALGMLKDLERAKSVNLKTIRFWEFDAVIREKRYEKDSVLSAKMHVLAKGLPKPIESLSKQLQTQRETQTQRERETTDPDLESSTEPREKSEGKNQGGSASSPPGAALPDGAHPSHSTSKAVGARGNLSLLNTPTMRRGALKA